MQWSQTGRNITARWDIFTFEVGPASNGRFEAKIIAPINLTISKSAESLTQAQRFCEIWIIYHDSTSKELEP